ncbi:MAG: hypothetical protein JWO16_19, partial [Sphingomonas bacterium]|nr:hypothetical protein [Sphingomonas bacterium]
MFKGLPLAISLTTVLLAAHARADEVGVTDTTISIGSFAPLSGPRAPLSAYNRQ